MIQIDMPMPTNCLDCPACNEYLMCAVPVNGRKWGENDVREFGQGRPEWCPMKEQEPLVRCKDCKHGDLWSDENVIVCDKLSKTRSINWYCADGVRKDESTD